MMRPLTADQKIAIAIAAAVGTALGLGFGYSVARGRYIGFADWLYWAFQYEYSTFGGFAWGLAGCVVGAAAALAFVLLRR